MKTNPSAGMHPGTRMTARPLLVVMITLCACSWTVSSASAPEDRGRGDGKDVITIGDSWMSYEAARGIQASLMKVSGHSYRTYGAGGAQLLNGEIPNQYALARRANPEIKTVVMTGGGNDLLRTAARFDLASAGPNARMQIDRLADRLASLWTEMAKDGVKDIVYVYYSRGGGLAASVNYGTAKIRPICQAVTPAHCYWVDSDEAIHMMLRDGIHPTDQGFDALGTVVYALMEKAGIRR